MPDPTVEVYNTEGGSVSIAWVPEQVWFLWVSAAPDWAYEIEEEGPPEVEVEFKKHSDEIKFKAKWQNGELVVQITES